VVAAVAAGLALARLVLVPPRPRPWPPLRRRLFRRRYDYRDEWLRFVATLSAEGRLMIQAIRFLHISQWIMIEYMTVELLWVTYGVTKRRALDLHPSPPGSG
jgi:hypothetical protein